MGQQLFTMLLMPFVFLGLFAGMARAQVLDTIQLSTDYYSVAENSGAVTIQLRRSGPMTDYASLQVSTVTNTAGTNDFEVFSRTVTFAPGQSNMAVSIAIYNDSLPETMPWPLPPLGSSPREIHEFFEIVLSDPDPFCCELGPIARARIEIRDNDPGLEFGAYSYSFYENAGEVQIDVVRFGDMTNAAGSVAFDIVDETARRNVDFVIATNRVSFTAGQTNATISVLLLNDAVVEDGRYFVLRFEQNPDPTCCPLGDVQTTSVWIHDNDIGVEFDAYSQEVGEEASEIQLTLRRAGDWIGEEGYVTLQVYVEPSWSPEFKAIPNVDFAAPADPILVFLSPGETNVTFSIPILNDSLVENSESFGVMLLNDPFGLPLGYETNLYVSIIDNDLGVEFVRHSYQIAEPGGALEISVRRVGDATNEFSVDVEVGGTATVNQDFLLPTNRLFFPSGQSNVVTLSVSVLDDPLVENPQEYLSLNLHNPTSDVPLGRQSSTQIILHDNEYPAASPGFWLATNRFYAVENGTNGRVSVIRGGNSSSSLRVEFVTAGDAVTDFAPNRGTVTFNPLETRKEIVLEVSDDCRVETEKAEIALTNPSPTAVIFEPGQATLEIVDDDGPGSLHAFNPTLDWLGIPDDSPYYAASAAVAVQPDGRIIVGHNGVIARIDTFGAQDTSFAHGATICGLAGRFIVTSACDVYTIVVEPGGNILAGGFGSIIRLNPAGLVDSNFVLTAISYGFHGVTFPGRINKLLLQPDGRIVVFGAFNLINGESMRSPIRLNTDSSIERSFRSDGFWATDGALLPEGKLLANGLSSLARLHSDGSLDEDFANAGTDGEIRAVAVLEDQRILIGGRFSYVAGESHRALARLNANGSLDTNFNPVVVLDNAGGIVAVQALTAGRKGHLFLAGSFADGSTRVLKLDSEGRVISVFNSGLQFNTAQGFPGAINSIIEEPNGEVLVAGNFDNVSSIPRPGIARLKGVRSHVHLTAPALQPDGSLRVVTGSQVGSRYVLQGSIDLRSWSNIATGTATACTLELYDPNPASARFYRVQLER